MEDYQILIDHAWSMNPDLFEMFRKQFQIELDKRRPFIKEYQELVCETFHEVASTGERIPMIDWRLREAGRCNPMRKLLPKKISRNKEPSHPSIGSWMTPIDTINY